MPMPIYISASFGWFATFNDRDWPTRPIALWVCDETGAHGLVPAPRVAVGLVRADKVEGFTGYWHADGLSEIAESIDRS